MSNSTGVLLTLRLVILFCRMLRLESFLPKNGCLVLHPAAYTLQTQLEIYFSARLRHSAVYAGELMVYTFLPKVIL